jgi:hypothetical protein
LIATKLITSQALKLLTISIDTIMSFAKLNAIGLELRLHSI